MEYYMLKDLEKMVQLKPRMLKHKMNKVKEKYKNKPDLLFKMGRRWMISEKIIFEFDRIRKGLKKHHYKSFVTISFDGDASAKFINEIVKTAHMRMNKTMSSEIEYVIELNRRNKNHLHFICNWEHNRNNEKIIYNIFNLYSKINFDMRPINDYTNLKSYLNKRSVYSNHLF